MSPATFIQDNPKLVSHLEKYYGHALERDEIINTMWVAAAGAGIPCAIQDREI